MIFDNLRRSLVPPALLAALLVGCLAPLENAGVLLAMVLAVWFVPDMLQLVSGVIRKPRRLPWRRHVMRVVSGVARQLAIKAVQLACLPTEAWGNVMAIARVFWRRLASGRRLLEWQTAHDADRAAHTGLWRLLWAMRPSWLAGAAVLTVAIRWRPDALAKAAPLGVLWLLGPVVAWWLSRPVKPAVPRFTVDQEQLLRRLARRTWAYFATFMGPAQNHLPADNYQEEPAARLAERTSPTNIGIGLLSALAARDFGYITSGRLMRWVGETFATMDRLPRYRGHFYNWYSTRDGQPLRPLYVSSVDSGNLTGHLITLRGGLEEIPAAAIIPARWREGLLDTAGLVLEEAEAAASAHAGGGWDLRRVRSLLREMMERIAQASSLLPAIAAEIARVQAVTVDLAASVGNQVETAFWIEALGEQARDFGGDVGHLAPWLAAVAAQSPRPPGSVSSEEEALLRQLNQVPTLEELADMDRPLMHALEETAGRHPEEAPEGRWWASVRAAVATAGDRAAERITLLRELAQRAEEFADNDLEFLFDPQRKVLSIGYHVDGGHLDPGGYDLLASEARQTSFVGVAQGKLPQEHWFVLGRQTTPGVGPLSLVSWSGSMFEYLMPLLVMPTYEGTLLDRAMRGAVRRQIRYGRRRGVPWGISESCYNQVDRELTYQYRAFGVPELGLKRGLTEDLVVAPYASALALMLLPQESVANLQALVRRGFAGRYGLYESIDYTPARVPADQDYALVRCFMAHHSGMSLLSLAHVLLGRPMQRRFLRDPALRASLLLLHERVPVAGAVVHHAARLPEKAEAAGAESGHAPTMRVLQAEALAAAVPEIHLLSNGQYTVMVTAAGGGFTRWKDLALTRWREDTTCDAWGTFIYFRDMDTGETWGATYQPLGASWSTTK